MLLRHHLCSPPARRRSSPRRRRPPRRPDPPTRGRSGRRYRPCSGDRRTGSRTANPPPVAANSSAAISAATTEPRPDWSANGPFISFRMPTFTTAGSSARAAPEHRLKRQQQRGHQNATAIHMPETFRWFVGSLFRILRAAQTKHAASTCAKARARWLIACFSSGSISPKVCLPTLWTGRRARTSDHSRNPCRRAAARPHRPSMRPRNVSVWPSGQARQSAAMNQARRSGFAPIRSFTGAIASGEILRRPRPNAPTERPARRPARQRRSRNRRTAPAARSRSPPPVP